MTDKPVSPGKPRTFHGIGMDAASTASFQALGPKVKAAATPQTTPREGYVTRADSMSTANFQSLARKAAPATASANTTAAASAPAKTGGSGKAK